MVKPLWFCLLLINVYMPCDTQSIHCLNPVYSKTISDIETLLFDHIGDVILGGDWNKEPSRDTAQSKSFGKFFWKELPVCLLKPRFSDTTTDLYQWFAACNFVSRSFCNVKQCIWQSEMMLCLYKASESQWPQGYFCTDQHYGYFP